MRKILHPTVYLFLGLIILLLCGSAAGEDSNEADLIPKNLSVEEKFQPGTGEPVGEILRSIGKGIIIHKNESVGYSAAKGLPLYKGDTIVTLEKARLRFKLNDGSILTMTAESKMEINRSVYNPDKKTRSTFLDVKAGKARAWAVKMKDYKQSEFKMKTKTAVAGVRGSDFMVESYPDYSNITAFKDTLLEVTSIAFPESEPMLLSDFKASRVDRGALPSEPVKIDIKEVEKMMRGFLFAGERYHSDKMVEEGEKADHPADKESKDDSSSQPQDQQITVPLESVIESSGTLFPPEILIKPDSVDMLNILDDFNTSDILRIEELSRITEHFDEQQSDIIEEIREDFETWEPLPEPVGGP